MKVPWEKSEIQVAEKWSSVVADISWITGGLGNGQDFGPCIRAALAEFDFSLKFEITRLTTALKLAAQLAQVHLGDRDELGVMARQFIALIEGDQ